MPTQRQKSRRTSLMTRRAAPVLVDGRSLTVQAVATAAQTLEVTVNELIFQRKLQTFAAFTTSWML